MIINKSGIVIRLAVSECRIMGRATQGVRLINLAKKNDVIASVCKVMGSELENQVKNGEWNNNTSETDSEPTIITDTTEITDVESTPEL